MIFVYLQKINSVIISIEVIRLKLANREVNFSIKSVFVFNPHFYLAESLAERTRTYWPYMTLFTIGAFLASFVLICCLCHKIRQIIYNKRIAKGNFESKYFLRRLIIEMNIFHLDLTYRNHNSHINSNGQTSLGNINLSKSFYICSFFST
jgi:hypothetical protein